MRFTERILWHHSLYKRLGVKTKTFPRVDENKWATYTTEGCGNIEVSIDGAPAKDIRRACAVDPANTRKLLALVRKDSEPPYRRNRVGFAAILKGKK